MLLDEKRYPKRYPNGINPVVNDEFSDDVAYECRESGEELKKMHYKLLELGGRLVNVGENEHYYDTLMEILRDIDVFIDDIKEQTGMIEDAMGEERKHHGGYALNILRRAE